MRAAERTILCGVVSMGNPRMSFGLITSTRRPLKRGRFWKAAGVFRNTPTWFYAGCRREHIRLRVYERGAGETARAAAARCAARCRGDSAGANWLKKYAWNYRAVGWISHGKGPGHPLYMTGRRHISTTDLSVMEATRKNTGNAHGTGRSSGRRLPAPSP